MNTQQKIIEAAISVLNENFSASLEDIAVRCGINRRTLHRYFKSRSELLEACNKNMMEAWELAAIKAWNSSNDPLVQLEHLLYAGIDSGTKYAFLIKLNESVNSSSTINETEQNTSYFKARNQLFDAIRELQNEKVIDDRFPLPWIRILFTSVITATITALRSGDIAQNEIRKLAWQSFSRSIGIQINPQK
ncbi:TetR/AcrR family transcriptional regulator [Chryseobacterium pennipullorum]|uniref:TetR/AcrR family transcriptional regulator n=1 Tax=Chryseobacterium pennipullorum TaxID=2258963 RepID=A0A3D9ANK1_9FLAO|nr:TetR/AcrR family transcriptional regulator [Chryseobacterium pennipullorum]REC42914.1 TetR/AcrR family transcriptional regulator [Chryseobacterium pennipullorum]